MYTLRLVCAFEGYRRIALLVLAAVTIWRAGYFNKGHEVTFFARYGWLDWSSLWLDETHEVLLYIIITLVEIAAVMAAPVVVIESAVWVCRGFNPMFHSDLPELSGKSKAKLLRIGSRMLGLLSAAPVGLVIFGLVVGVGIRQIPAEGWVFIAALVLASIIGWITAGRMSKKARELNKERAGNEQHGIGRRAGS